MESQKVKLSDPRHLYPRPPFPKQGQDLPGTEQRMEPAADHGEESYLGRDQLRGLVALVTGGDSGIGRAVALAYAREGADVCFTYLTSDEDAEETARLVREAGVRVLPIQMDQRGREACDDTVLRCQRELGGIDILVNNAGVQRTYENFLEASESEVREVFETNIDGLLHFCRAALPLIPAGGCIINTTSIQAFKPSANLAPYSATKAAIANLTLSLAEEASERGVRVNGVAPGPVWTPLIPATFPEDKVAEFGKGTLLGRPAQPAELAPVYVFLASPMASFISGEIYGVTGGEKQL